MGITIKGKNGGGFEIEVTEQTSFSELKEALVKKFKKNKDFFAGSEAKLVFSGKEMTKAQKRDLRRLLKMDYDITEVSFCGELSKPESQVGIKRVEAKEQFSSVSNDVKLISKNHFKAESIFVSHTLRSGQRIECTGDVVVLGDVNVGAQVIAGGSVAVMGTLRGLVHAGANGRSDVVIAANNLLPGQLRISGKIAVFPEDKQAHEPEIAEYREGSVVIRPLKPKRNNK